MVGVVDGYGDARGVLDYMVVGDDVGGLALGVEDGAGAGADISVNSHYGGAGLFYYCA